MEHDQNADSHFGRLGRLGRLAPPSALSSFELHQRGRPRQLQALRGRRAEGPLGGAEHAVANGRQLRRLVDLRADGGVGLQQQLRGARREVRAGEQKGLTGRARVQALLAIRSNVQQGCERVEAIDHLERFVGRRLRHRLRDPVGELSQRCLDALGGGDAARDGGWSERTEVLCAECC